MHISTEKESQEKCSSVVIEVLKSLTEEEKDPQDGAEGPRELHNDAHLEVRRLVHGVRGLDVEVGHGLGVGQDAGGDHEGQHVHRDQQHRAHSEREQQTLARLETCHDD